MEVKENSPFKFAGFYVLESKIVRADIPLNGLELKFKISPSGVISAEKLFKLILKIEIKDI